MTKILIDRSTVEQALKALKMMGEKYGEYACDACDHADAAIDALRERLAQPEQEPMHNVQSNGRHSPLLTHMMNKQTTPPQPERHKLQADGKPVLQDIEQYRMQMAGICTAAIGYWKEGDGIHPDYDTPALRDVARLYAKYDALYKAQSEQEPVAWMHPSWADPDTRGWPSESFKSAQIDGWTPLYTAPPQRKPLPPQSPCEMTQAEGKMFKLGWLECEAAHGIKGEA